MRMKDPIDITFDHETGDVVRLAAMSYHVTPSEIVRRALAWHCGLVQAASISKLAPVPDIMVGKNTKETQEAAFDWGCKLMVLADCAPQVAHDTVDEAVVDFRRALERHIDAEATRIALEDGVSMEWPPRRDGSEIRLIYPGRARRK